MSANLIPISSDGGFISGGDITYGGYASPAPSINGFSSASFTGNVVSGNLLLSDGIIQGGIHTDVSDGINSIALTYGAQMDVYGFPFSIVPTRGRLTISDVTTPSEANGTWYYQATSTNSYQLYTDSTYEVLVDATGWSAYTGGGTVSITKNIPAANVVIDSNGFLTKFANDGSVTFPSNTVITGSAVFAGNLVGTGASPAPSINGFDSASFANVISVGNLAIDSHNVAVTGGFLELKSFGDSGYRAQLLLNASNAGSSIALGLDGSYDWTFTDTTFSGNNISVTGNISGNTNGFAIGYLNIPQIAASNSTIVSDAGGKHYYSATAGNFTLTVPNNATTSFATGTAINIVVQAAGNILVNAASGVTLYLAGNSTAANRAVGAYGMATLMKVATDTWFINGTGVS